MSTQPSAAYRRHHDVEAPAVDARAFRQGWRVQTRLDVLHRSGRLTAGEWQVAVEYRDAWERVLVATSGSSTLVVRVSGGAGDGVGERLAAVADTITRLRTTEAAIGAFADKLCFECIVRDTPWVLTGKVMRCDRETARDVTVAAIRRLALAWSEPRRRARHWPAQSGGQSCACL